jgi:membrane protein DedA with SNARE-associated domain
VPDLPYELLLTLAEGEPSLKEQLIFWISEYSYVGVFLFLLACGLGFPSPEEVALIGGGYAVYLDDPNSWPKVLLMVAVAMAGVLVGDVLLYLIGRRVGDHPEKVPIIGRHLTPARMRKARANFQKHGAKTVFFGRFLFGIRAVTFFISGSMRVPLVTFVIMDGLAALLTVPISVILAWHFGGKLQEAFDYIKALDTVVLVVVAAGAGAALVAYVRSRRIKEDAEEAEVQAVEKAAEVAQKLATVELARSEVIGISSAQVAAEEAYASSSASAQPSDPQGGEVAGAPAKPVAADAGEGAEAAAGADSVSAGEPEEPEPALE